ncbi:subtilisin-like protein [Pholiota conissans]|uniref:Subtilisin-like protein n=1 Tax=Pholiota conissans TaxID=109636 RepID=A0A9P6CXP2_9AGAR|nr:subtilisin-like protein [Pholiota conissans]
MLKIWGQAYPDVAAQCDKYRIVVGDTFGLVGGVSAASPTFAGIISLVNNVRISAGKPVLGFLNPFLYSTGFSALNDITIGNNAGCGTPGFNATTGWDPVTGLGSPNFHLLKSI